MKFFFVSHFISSRLINSKSNTFSRLAYIIGIIILSLSISSMIAFSLMLEGMHKTITKKIFELNGHLHINDYQYFNNKLVNLPINIHNINFSNFNNNIEKIYPYCDASALIKFKNEISGAYIKGIDLKFDNYKHIKNYLIKGSFLEENDKGILLGKTLADNLKIKLNDQLTFFFFSDPPRFRKFKVIGIYKTNIQEIDEKLIFSNLENIQKVNNYNPNLVTGYEILLNDLKKIDKTAKIIAKKLNYQYNLTSVKKQFSSIFDWLLILNQNKNILFTIVLTVICATIVSIILIQLIERTPMVGILKSLGAQDKTISMIFFFIILNILSRGIILGNLGGIAFCLGQQFFKFIKLDPEGIYLEYAIIDWNIISIIIINLLFLTIISFITFIFSYLIVKFQPRRILNWN